MDQYVGEIRMFAGNFAPRDWELCDGRLLQIYENEPLFALIGTTYGGDGVSTFAVPDLRGRVPIHYGQLNGTGTHFSLGEKGGTEQVTLTTNQLPAHTHIVNAHNTAGDSESPANHYWSGGVLQYSDNAPNQTMSVSSVSGEGGTHPHDNVMPFQAINFIICLAGVYPTPD